MRPGAFRRLDMRRPTNDDGATAASEPVRPTDANALGLWVALDATDNGTALTVPNRIAGGAALVSTGVGRPTISATGIEGRRQGINMAASSQALSAAVDLSTRKACTVYVGVYGGGTTAGFLFAHGTAVERINAVYNRNTGGADSPALVRVSKTNAVDETFHVSRSLNGGAPASPSVYCFTFDIDDPNPQEIGNPRVDDEQMTIVDYGGTPGTGTFTNSTLWACQSNAGGTPFNGHLGCLYIRHGRHSAAEITTWTTYLQWFMGTQNEGAPIAKLVWGGHSIVDGESSDLGGYRAVVQSAYLADTARTFAFRATGEFSSDGGLVFPQDYMFAAGGWTIADLLVYVNSRFGSGAGNRWFPGILFLQSVTNDLAAMAGSAPSDFQAVATALGGLIDAAKGFMPKICIVVSTELPRTDNATWQARVTTWNATYAPQVVADAVSRGVNCILDTTMSTTGGVTTSDGLHPTQAGYAALGAALYPRVPTWIAAWKAGL